MARIDISFKNTVRDQKLYKFLYELEDRSYLIKEALRSYFAKDLESIVIKEIETIDKKEFSKNVEDEEININIDLDDF